MFEIDDVPMHKIENINQKKFGTKISMIPEGLARCLQPLDVSINKPYKDELRKNIQNITWSKKKAIQKYLKKISYIGL